MLHTKNILAKYATGLYLGQVAGSAHAVKCTAVAAAAAAAPRLTVAEVAKHNTKEDCWIVIENKVYDVTTFLGEHPGGKRAILMYAGKDATKEFQMLHNKNILKKYAKSFYLGPLMGASQSSVASKL